MEFTISTALQLTDVLSITVAIIALVVSIICFRKTRALEKYEICDQMLFELLRITLEHSEFNDQAFTDGFTPEKLQADIRYKQYDVYAMMIWNYMETLYDHFGRKILYDAQFSGAVEYWARLHAVWYRTPGNREYYADIFEEIIK